MNKTIYFARIINDIIIENYTEYQAEVIFGSRDLDVYQNDEYKLVRIYRDETLPLFVEGSTAVDPTNIYNYRLSYTPGDTKAYELFTATPRTEEQMAELDSELPKYWAIIRRVRDSLLVESDKESGAIYQDIWNSLAPDKKAAWETYRQALRNIPQDNETPFGIVWPVKPS